MTAKFKIVALMTLVALLATPAVGVAASKAAANTSSGSSGFALGLFLTGTYGSMQSADGSSIRPRNMLGTIASAQFGYAFGFIEPLVELTYQHIGQLTKVAEVSNQNQSGSGTLVGAGAKLHIESFFVTGVVDFMGSYKLTKENEWGESSSYSKPLGFHVQAGKSFGNFSAGLTYLAESFSTIEVAGVEEDVSSNKFKETMFGVFVGLDLF